MDAVPTVLVIAAAVCFILMGRACGIAGVRQGRCVELCRPEKLIEVVNDGRECLCTTRRAKLERVP